MRNHLPFLFATLLGVYKNHSRKNDLASIVFGFSAGKREGRK